MTLIVKDPESRIDFKFDWATAYPGGHVLTASAWVVLPDEAGGIDVAGASYDLAEAAVTLAGGIAGHVYRVTNRVTLNDGQIDERSMTVRVEER